jgi:hypothetical protein
MSSPDVASKVRFQSPWNVVLIVAGLTFVGFGFGMVFIVYDLVSNFIGVGVVVIGVYAIVLGLRRSVVVDDSGVTVRAGAFSSTFTPWRNITSIKVEETNCILVNLCVPVLKVRSGQVDEDLTLDPIAYYRFRRGVDSGPVVKLRRRLNDAK